MITNWKAIDPLLNNTTTFRFWCNNEENDLTLAENLVGKYVELWGYTIKGTIKILYDKRSIFYEILTNLPYTTYIENNDFFEFSAVSPKEIKGIKNK